MKNIILLSLLCFHWPFQTADLVGKWSYAKYESSTKLDDETKAGLNSAFSKFSFEFRKDGTYDFNKVRKKETGTWKATSDLLTTTTSNGVTDEIKFIQKHKDTLRLEIEKGDYMVFYRSE